MSWVDVNEWIRLIVRWVHVFAAILWIGQIYLFNFLEKNLETNETNENIAGNLWMVHGGGFYLIEKQKVPELVPQKLHWFKWEAATTWISGILLISLTYYLGGLLVEPHMNPNLAAASGIGVVVLGWVIYDLMVRSALGEHEMVLGIISFILILGIAYGLCQVQSSRAAFMHVGALFGSIMAANVWLRILPAQRKMIALTREGKKPGDALASTGPLRSKHNTYTVVPLVFLMISNHFPTISYGHPYNWIVLGGLVLAGWGAAKILRG